MSLSYGRLTDVVRMKTFLNTFLSGMDVLNLHLLLL